MSSNLVIVAIPAEDDLVWKVSSEKVPHLTLMYLGEVSEVNNAGRMVEFVQHALNVSEHGPFYLDVDYRGTLGPDEADVLFFSNGWDAKWIKSLRGQLLQENNIRTAFESTDQFPEWQPHLTLGYPTAPAKELDDPNAFNPRFYSVHFDRIAVWVDDYDGPEFRLKWPEREYNDCEMAIHSVDDAHGKPSLEDAIEHFGTKGMKWGQRNSPERQAAKSAKKVAKADKKFEKQNTSAETWVKLHNAGADHVNQALPGINAHFDKKYPKEMKDGTLFNESHPVTREYTKAYNDKFVEGLDKGAKSLGTNASGTRKIKIVSENHDSMSEFGWSFGTGKVQHAADDEELVFVAKRDEQGRVISIESMEDSMAQSDAFVVEYIENLDRQDPSDKVPTAIELGAEFLEHHGVKGMKWGQRREQFRAGVHNRRVAAEAAVREKRPAQDVRAYPTIGKSKRSPGHVDTKGGEDHPPTQDAIKVHSARQKLKKSGTDALTNDELKEVANRLNLEQQVRQLEAKSPRRKSLGRQFIEKFMSDKDLQKQAGGFALKTVAKKSAKVGAAAALL